MPLQSVRHLHGCVIHAQDGDLGHIDQFYFDDATWTLRYLVVRTGSWLLRNKVLIPAAAIANVDSDDCQFKVNLTCRQINESPSIETHRPVSRRWEAELHRYYSWPAYWDSAILEPLTIIDVPEPPVSDEDTHLQSTHDLVGYHIEGDGGKIGRLADFLIDASSRAIAYLDIDTRDRATHRHILFPPAAIDRLDWESARAHTTLTASFLSNAPSYNPAIPLPEEIESQVRAFYAD